MFSFRSSSSPQSKDQPSLKRSSSSRSLSRDPLTDTLLEADENPRHSRAVSEASGKRPSLASLASLSGLTTVGTNASAIPLPANSWGNLMLTALRDEEGDFADVVQLLHSKKALLLLPVSQPSHPSALIDREFVEDHVFVYHSNTDTSHVISLNGIRGCFQSDRFIALGLLPTESEISSILLSASSPKSTIFDTLTLDPTSIKPDHPFTIILASHVEIPLGAATITTTLIQKPIAKSDIIEWTRRTQDIPLRDSKQAGEREKALLAKCREFVNDFKKKMVGKSIEVIIDMVQDFFEEVRTSLEEQMKTETEENIDEGGKEKEMEEKMEWVERFVCADIYDIVFSFPMTDDNSHDEALGSRIAALNILELNLANLGVDANDTEVMQMESVVRTAGEELQRLDVVRAPGEKVATLVKVHRIISEALQKHSDVGDTIKETASTEAQNSAEAKESKSEVLNSDHTSTEPQPPTLSQPENLGDSQIFDEKRRVFSADVLLPILIFSVVKSNPPRLVSNLRYIQRFRLRNSLLTGEAAYCLTNMLAVVAFLETTNLVGLGLSADKVLSDITDFQSARKSSVTESLPISSSVDTASLHHSRRQNASTSDLPYLRAQLTDNAQKLLSNTLDSSYKILGRWWSNEGGRTAESVAGVAFQTAGMPAKMVLEEVRNAVARVSGAEGGLGRGHKELKEMGNPDSGEDSVSIKSTSARSGSTLPPLNFPVSSLLENRAEFRIGSASGSRSESPAQLVATSPIQYDPPMQKFLDVRPDELKIGDVHELLADYKRLAAILKQNNLC